MRARCCAAAPSCPAAGRGARSATTSRAPASRAVTTSRTSWRRSLVARLAGAPPAAVQEAIDTVEPLPHRLALVAERDGVRWFDDSKATNVGATVKSLESFAEPVVLLAGRRRQGRRLRAARRRGARPACAARSSSARRASAWRRRSRRPTWRSSGWPTCPPPSSAAAAAARPGDVVLLAPACSSFDMFTDYAARGRAFRAAVEGLR